MWPTAEVYQLSYTYIHEWLRMIGQRYVNLVHAKKTVCQISSSQVIFDGSQERCSKVSYFTSNKWYTWGPDLVWVAEADCQSPERQWTRGGETGCDWWNLYRNKLTVLSCQESWKWDEDFEWEDPELRHDFQKTEAQHFTCDTGDALVFSIFHGPVRIWYTSKLQSSML